MKISARGLFRIWSPTHVLPLGAIVNTEGGCDLGLVYTTKGSVNLSGTQKLVEVLKNGVKA